jgi:transcription elongation factor Elf1
MRFFLRGEGCNIQVVRQLDTKFGCITCKHVIVHISCTKHKGEIVNYEFHKFLCAIM